MNDGTIAGRGANPASAGVRLFNGAGAGTTVTVTDDIVNNGTISAEAGAALLIQDVAFTGTFTNNGTLTGPNAVDASTASSAINFVQNGGELNGTFLGSAFTDSLTFENGAVALTNDIVGDVDVTIADSSTVTINGDRSIDGGFTSNGTLNFDLDVNSLAVDGDTVLGAGSVVNIATTQITQADIGVAIDVITETGSFTDNGAAINVIDDDFLIDYEVTVGSIVVTPTAADLSAVSSDANINAFGGALDDAVAAALLPTGIFDALNGSASAADFEATALSLLPSINEGVTREIFETQNAADSYINERLQSEGSLGLWGQLLGRTANRDAENTSVLGYDADAFGFALGLDFGAGENVRIGIAYSYADIDVDQDGAGQEESQINASQISAYFGYNGESVFVNGQIGYSFSDVDSSRTGAAGPISGAFDVDGFRGQVNAGLELGGDKLSFQPFIGLNYANLSSDSYTETGGLALDVDAGDVDYFEGKIGARVATQSDGGFSLRANLAYAYDFAGDARTFDLNFAGAGAPFRLVSTDGEESRFEFGAGIGFGKVDGLSLGLEYQGEIASGYNSHSGLLRLRYAF